MSSKNYRLDNQYDLSIRKRRGVNKLTLRINNKGIVIITMPHYAPYSAAIKFAHHNLNWIKENTSSVINYQIGGHYELYDGTNIIISSAKHKNSVIKKTGTFEIKIIDTSQNSQKFIQKKINDFLKNDTQNIVNAKIDRLTKAMDLYPLDINFRTTTTRWGSCNSKKVICFSNYLCQLSDNLIEYVIVHELAHLKYLNHSNEFWRLVGEYCPKYKQLKQDLKNHETKAIIRQL